jgi:hypothetical protein
MEIELVLYKQLLLKGRIKLFYKGKIEKFHQIYGKMWLKFF